MTVPMTGLIVSHNEAHLIGARLRELAFCDELLVIDVASTDDTAAVAEANGARVIPHPFARIAELVHPDVVRRGPQRHDRDPRSRRGDPAACWRARSRNFPSRWHREIGFLLVPRIFYFRGRPLRGTIWGGVGGKRPSSRGGAAPSSFPLSTAGSNARPGTASGSSSRDGENAIRHHWVSGYREFIKKHVRYLRIEGAGARVDGR